MSDGEMTVLRRWFDRFNRALSTYNPSFGDETFDDLTAVLVTGAFIEGMLWVAIQFAGYPVTKAKKDLALGQIIREGVARKVVQPQIELLLWEFANLRNEFAHDIDAKLDNATVDSIETLLPAANRQRVEASLSNIPCYRLGSKARVVFGELGSLAYESLQVGISQRRLD